MKQYGKSFCSGNNRLRAAPFFRASFFDYFKKNLLAGKISLEENLTNACDSTHARFVSLLFFLFFRFFSQEPNAHARKLARTNTRSRFLTNSINIGSLALSWTVWCAVGCNLNFSNRKRSIMRVTCWHTEKEDIDKTKVHFHFWEQLR